MKQEKKTEKKFWFLNGSFSKRKKPRQKIDMLRQK